MKNLVCILVTCLGLFSCQSVVRNSAACHVDSWILEGKRDALNGRSIAYFIERIEDCPSFNNNMVYSLYSKGYEQGYLSYCTTENGYKVGLYNRNYSGICGSSDEAFLSSYHQGLQTYQVNQKITQSLVGYKEITQQIEVEKSKQRRLLLQIEANRGTNNENLLLKELASSKNYLNELVDEIYFLDKALKKHESDLEKVKKH